MTEPSTRRHSPAAAHPVTSAAIAVLLVALIFFALWTPIYSRVTPKIGSWPFFYSYLLILTPVTSLVLWLVVLLQRRLARPADGEASQ